VSDLDTTDIVDIKDQTPSELNDRLAEVRGLLADEDAWDIDYDGLSTEEDALVAEIEKRKRAKAKQQAKPEPVAPTTISGRIKVLEAELAEATEALDGMARETNAPGAPPLTVVRDEEGNPVGAAEATSVVASASRAEAFQRVTRLREELAEAQRRLPFEGLTDRQVLEASEDAAIRREDLRRELQAAQAEGRHAAARKAERLLGELEDTVFPLFAEDQLRKAEAGQERMLEAMTNARALKLREQRVREWEAEYAQRQKLMDMAVRGEASAENMNASRLTEAAEMVKKWKALLEGGTPPAQWEIDAARETVEANPAVRSLGPNVAEIASW
jgi:hypothetical protein